MIMTWDAGKPPMGIICARVARNENGLLFGSGNIEGRGIMCGAAVLRWVDYCDGVCGKVCGDEGAKCGQS
jgi:hypothetical protein